tara:strand:+ start:1427 stop:1984 length:558 start_codon:yes stop_codon:yes gene_type:complete
MKKNFLLTSLFYIFFLPVQADVKDDLILNLKKTNNLVFYFKQTISDKIEKGKCIIEYPKKIWCSYDNINKKIIVSNGKSLVINNRFNNQYYIYPLEKTPLNLILDKNFLINKIKNLEPRNIDNKYLNFTLKENDSKINLFFDYKTLNLIGWQTEDIYQNLVITFISNVRINEKIDKNIFKLPKKN